MGIYLNTKRIGTVIPTKNMYTYEFNTVQDMKESQYNFKKGDTIYVSKYYPSIELIDSELI